MTDLLKYIRSFANFSEESWEVLRAILVEVEFKKAEVLVEADKTCNSLFFISKGFCRAFYINDGVQINTNFYFENDTATNINSYALSLKSSCTIQACEAMITYRIDKNKIFEASKLAPEIEIVGKRNLQMIAAKQERQIELYRLLTATQRYEYLEIHQPEILQRVSLTQLSSYLGVARETLSRIRKKRLRN